jgi:hypothetical protein
MVWRAKNGCVIEVPSSPAFADRKLSAKNTPEAFYCLSP